MTNVLRTQGRCSRRAFTLIELLVVISIIALLIGILLPALGSARESARGLICQTNMRSIGQSYELYMNDQGIQNARFLTIYPQFLPDYAERFPEMEANGQPFAADASASTNTSARRVVQSMADAERPTKHMWYPMVSLAEHAGVEPEAAEKDWFNCPSARGQLDASNPSVWRQRATTENPRPAGVFNPWPFVSFLINDNRLDITEDRAATFTQYWFNDSRIPSETGGAVTSETFNDGAVADPWTRVEPGVNMRKRSQLEPFLPSVVLAFEAMDWLPRHGGRVQDADGNSQVAGGHYLFGDMSVGFVSAAERYQEDQFGSVAYFMLWGHGFQDDR